LLDLLFGPEDGGDMFLQNVDLSELHSITSQKAILLIVTVVRGSNPKKLGGRKKKQKKKQKRCPSA
jgi:hypothetical protein